MNCSQCNQEYGRVEKLEAEVARMRDALEKITEPLTTGSFYEVALRARILIAKEALEPLEEQDLPTVCKQHGYTDCHCVPEKGVHSVCLKHKERDPGCYWCNVYVGGFKMPEKPLGEEKE